MLKVKRIKRKDKGNVKRKIKDENEI